MKFMDTDKRGSLLPFKQYDFMDNAKAFAMLLVILEHTRHFSDFPHGLAVFIGTFSMPLFFFISGFLFSPEKHSSFGSFFAYEAKKTLLPYAVFTAVIVLLEHVVRSNEFSTEVFFNYLTGRYPPNWFFVALFLAVSFYYAALRLMRNKTAAVLVLLLLALAAMYMIDREAAIVRNTLLVHAVVASFFLALGNYAKNPSLINILTGSNRLALFAAFIAATALAVFMLPLIGHSDIYRHKFGNYFLYVPLACNGIFSVMLLSCAIPLTRAARWVSRNTLYIFPLQIYALAVFYKILEKAGLGGRFEDFLLPQALAVAFVVLSGFPVRLFYNAVFSVFAFIYGKIRRPSVS